MEVMMIAVVRRPSLHATGLTVPLACSVTARYSASQAPVVLRLKTAIVTLRLAKLG